DVLEEHRLGIGADAEERGVAERQVAGESAEDVPGRGDGGVHHGEDADVRDPVLGEHEGEGGERCGEAEPAREPGGGELPHSPPRSAVPSSPCGRTTSTAIRMTKNTSDDQVGEM